jgi:magnesium transporter
VSISVHSWFITLFSLFSGCGFGHDFRGSMQKLRYTTPGSPPATLVPLPEQAGSKPKLQLIEYDAHAFQEREIEVADLESLHESRMNWINVGGLGDVETLRKLGERFRIHPLALEDVFNTGQRPHLDEYDDQLFIVLQMAYQETEGELVFEQVSLFLGERYVITVQEDAAMDVFEPIRKRLREGLGNARFMRSDYLAYALIDAVIDQYFPLSEALGESIESMEEEVLAAPDREQLQQIHEFRQALAQLRRAVWPTREVLTRLLRDESKLVAEKTKPFLRDTLDHVLAIVDLLETYRDITTSFMDLYVSSLSMRTNDIMRVLTIVSSIFIPLTFIAGLYGMNFAKMPELHWRFGYPAVLILMGAVATGMILFFKRKNWL